MGLELIVGNERGTVDADQQEELYNAAGDIISVLDNEDSKQQDIQDSVAGLVRAYPFSIVSKANIDLVPGSRVKLSGAGVGIDNYIERVDYNPDEDLFARRVRKAKQNKQRKKFVRLSVLNVILAAAGIAVYYFNAKGGLYGE